MISFYGQITDIQKWKIENTTQTCNVATKVLFEQSNSHISLKNKLKKASEGNGPLFSYATKIRLLAAYNVFELHLATLYIEWLQMDFYSLLMFYISSGVKFIYRRCQVFANALRKAGTEFFHLQKQVKKKLTFPLNFH